MRTGAGAREKLGPLFRRCEEDGAVQGELRITRGLWFRARDTAQNRGNAGPGSEKVRGQPCLRGKVAGSLVFGREQWRLLRIGFAARKDRRSLLASVPYVCQPAPAELRARPGVGAKRCCRGLRPKHERPWRIPSAWD